MAGGGGGGGVWRTDCYSVLAQKKEMWCENDCMLSDKHWGGGVGGISFGFLTSSQLHGSHEGRWGREEENTTL